MFNRKPYYRNVSNSQPSNAELKEFPCRKCKKFGHWQFSHRKDGTLKHKIPSHDTREIFAQYLSNRYKKDFLESNEFEKRNTSFYMANIANSSSKNDNLQDKVV